MTESSVCLTYSASSRHGDIKTYRPLSDVAVSPRAMTSALSDAFVNEHEPLVSIISPLDKRVLMLKVTDAQFRSCRVIDKLRTGDTIE